MNEYVPYWEVDSPTRRDVLATLANGPPVDVTRAVLGIALYEDDLPFALEQVIGATDHESDQVRAAAIISIGHLARRFRELPQDVGPILEAALKDPSCQVREQAVSAIDDVTQFVATFQFTHTSKD